MTKWRSIWNSVGFEAFLGWFPVLFPLVLAGLFLTQAVMIHAEGGVFVLPVAIGLMFLVQGLLGLLERVSADNVALEMMVASVWLVVGVLCLVWAALDFDGFWGGWARVWMALMFLGCAWFSYKSTMRQIEIDKMEMEIAIRGSVLRLLREKGLLREDDDDE